MALVTCKDCGAQISRSANHCMKCGWRGASGNSMGALKILGWFFLVVFGLGFMGMCIGRVTSPSSSSSVPVPSSTPVIQPAAVDSGSTLIDKCAYNRSDMKYLGIVTAVGPVGVDGYGDAAPGQRKLTIMTSSGKTVGTYPKWLAVDRCP